MKKILMTLAAAAIAVSAVHAQTIVNIGGSTAGRTAVHNNIVAMLSGCTYAYDGTSGSPSKATHAIYHGSYGGNPYIVRTFWSGSVNGITPVTAGTQLDATFIDTSVTGLSGGQFIASPTLAAASANTIQNIGYSDIFASTVNVAAPNVEDEVAVITFKWYANEGTTGIDNITPGLVRNLYASSEAPKSLFTGNPEDTTTVYPIGRNADSGTRGTAMAESGYGNVASVDQYTATESGGVVTGITPSGNSGFSSGSSVKTVMNATYAGGILIGYLGASDFATAGAVELKWNGVAYSTDAIRNGQYSFWGYLHMNRMNTLSGNGLSFYNALKTNISADPKDSGVLVIDTMNVARDADGAPIYPL
jgi:hypothetical protein